MLSYSKYNPLLPFNYLNLHRAFCNEFIRGSYVFLTVVREESPVFCFCSFFLSDFGVSWSFSETPSTSNTFGEKKREKLLFVLRKTERVFAFISPMPLLFFRTAELSRIFSQVRKTATFWFSDNNAPLNSLSGTHNQGIATLLLSLYITVFLQTEIFLDWSQFAWLTLTDILELFKYSSVLYWYS